MGNVRLIHEVTRFMTMLLLATFIAQTARGEVVWLDQLDLANVVQGWGTAQASKSVQQNPLRIGTATFARGVGTHGPGQMALNLHGESFHFDAVVGIDAETRGRGSVVFQVIVDNRKVFDSGLLTGARSGVPVSLDLRGAQLLTLKVTDGGDGFDFDHADWADARITCADGSPPATLPLFSSDGFITARQPRTDPLVSQRAVDLARRTGQLWVSWTSTSVKGYQLLHIQPGLSGVETLTGKPPSSVVANFTQNVNLESNDVLVVEQKSQPAVQIRVLQQPCAGNSFHATIEIDAPFAVPRLELAIFRVPLTQVFKEFQTPHVSSDSQSKAEAAELSGNFKAASTYWEIVALSSRRRDVRAFALERYFNLLFSYPKTINSLERAQVDEAAGYYTKSGIPSAMLVGAHVIWVLPKNVITNASMQRAFAEADAVYGFLRYLTYNDTNGRLGRRMVIRFMPESNWSGGLEGDHGVGFGGKGPVLPYDGPPGLFHEISHDLMPGPNLFGPVPGFGEGWATFAVVPAFDYLGWVDWRDALNEKFLLAFDTYRAKGSNYDQLPGYDANAGFLLHITGRLCPDFDWTNFRAWQRAARNSKEPADSAQRVRDFIAILQSVGPRGTFDEEFFRSLGLPPTR